MPTVLLVRHGRTAANTAGVLAGRSPGVALDERGREQAEALRARLAPLPLAAAVTSPLERCVETAALALAGRTPALAAVPEDGLVECGYGTWTGRELTTLAKEPLWRQVQAHPAAAAFPEGESLAGMAARAVAAVRAHDARVAAEHGPESLWVAFSHGDVLKAVIADALGLHLDGFQRVVVDPASVSVVRYTELRPFVVRTNDVGGDLTGLVPPPRRRRARRARSARGAGDAVVGGGAGSGGGG